jgi:hypothetical protein
MRPGGYEQAGLTLLKPCGFVAEQSGQHRK